MRHVKDLLAASETAVECSAPPQTLLHAVGARQQNVQPRRRQAALNVNPYYSREKKSVLQRHLDHRPVRVWM